MQCSELRTCTYTFFTQLHRKVPRQVFALAIEESACSCSAESCVLGSGCSLGLEVLFLLWRRRDELLVMMVVMIVAPPPVRSQVSPGHLYPRLFDRASLHHSSAVVDWEEHISELEIMQ